MPLDPKSAPLFKALSHPRRIRIFTLLLEAQTPPNLTQLRTLSKLNNNAFTHHLSLMERAGLVRREKSPFETKIILYPEALGDLLEDYVFEISNQELKAA